MAELEGPKRLHTLRNAIYAKLFTTTSTIHQCNLHWCMVLVVVNNQSCRTFKCPSSPSPSFLIQLHSWKTSQLVSCCPFCSVICPVTTAAPVRCGSCCSPSTSPCWTQPWISWLTWSVCRRVDHTVCLLMNTAVGIKCHILHFYYTTFLHNARNACNRFLFEKFVFYVYSICLKVLLLS